MNWLKRRRWWQKLLLAIGVLIAVTTVLGLMLPNLDWFTIGRVTGWAIGIALVLGGLYYLGNRGKKRGRKDEQ